MKTTSAAIKLVIFVVVTSLATGLLAVTIANSQFVPTVQYHAIFSDVTGLMPGDDVRIAGVRVGQVDGIKLYKQRYAEVTFSVAKSRPLPVSTQVQIRWRNLVGQRYVSLSEGPGSATPLRPGSVIPLSQTQPALDLTVLFNGFRPLFRALRPQDVNQLSFEIIKVFQGEGGTVDSLLANVAALTNTLADRDAVIGQVIDNLNAVLGTVDQRDQQLSEMITQLQTLVSGLSADRKAIGDSLVGIDELTGVTAGLLRDARPDLQTDIANLGAVAKTLNDNRQLVDQTLQRVPPKINMLIRNGAYGSWINFYLCSFDAKITGPGGTVMYTPQIVNDNPRCKG